MAISPERMQQLTAMAQQIKSNPELMAKFQGGQQQKPLGSIIQANAQPFLGLSGGNPKSAKDLATLTGVGQDIIQQEKENVIADPFLKQITPEGMVMETVSTGPSGTKATFKRGTELEAEYKKAMDKAENEFKTPSGDVSGRMALSHVSDQYVNDARKILFPDDKPENFDRLIATLAKFDKPLQQASRILPNIDKKDVNKAQNVIRWLDNAISGKVLIKTGVAARPEEVAIERRSYIPGIASSPESAYEALGELQDFYKTFISLMDPSGSLSKRMTEATTPSDFSKMTDEELKKLIGEQ